MRQVVLSLATCCAMPTLYAQQEPLQVMEPKEMERFPTEIFTRYCPYESGIYIFNENYVLYQDCGLRKQFTPDRATFKVIRDHFSVDKNGVYYQGELVKVDTKDFKILGSRKIKEIQDREEGVYRYYWRTNEQVFFGTVPVAVSDPATFEPLTHCYYRDKNNVYYYDQVLEGVDPDKIILHKDRFSKEDRLCDGKYLYYKDKPVYYKGERLEQLFPYVFKTSKYVLAYTPISGDGDIETMLSELHSEDFDIPTLRVLSSNYLIDKNHLYYFLSCCPIIDDEGFRVPIPTKRLSKVRAYVSSATDGEKVYLGKEPIERDAATFAEFSTGDHSYQYDKNGVYDSREKLPFHYTNPPVYGKNLFSIEKAILYENQLYHDTFVVTLTAEQVKQLKAGELSYELFFSDSDGIGFYNISPFDRNFYTRLSYDLYKGKDNKVYYFDHWAKEKEALREVKGYDAATLKEITNGLLADKDYVYLGQYRVVKNKNFEVLAIYAGYRGESVYDRTDFYLLKNVEGYYLVEIGRRKAERRFLGKELKGFEI